MNKDVIIIGAGGHSAELDEYIAYANKLNTDQIKVVGFIDDNPYNYALYQFSAPLLGSIREHQIRYDCNYLMGIANLQYRKDFIELFLSRGATFTGFTHPTAFVSPTAHICEGVIIAPMANIGPNVSIGEYTLINSRCSIGHDTVIGKYNFITPNVCFSGFTKIGDGNLFGINSATIPGIKIGDNNKIAAGMVLDKPIGDDEVVFHRFKERVIVVPKADKNT